MLTDKLLDNPIKFFRVLDKHEMVSALFFFEDFQLCAFNLPGYPIHGLPGPGTDTPADHKGLPAQPAVSHRASPEKRD
jgi:hypothetical protein